MKVSYCDICYQVIKPQSKKHVLCLHTMVHETTDDKAELQEKILKSYQYRSPELYEVCQGCKKVLEYFFHIRKDELRKIQKELEKISRKRSGDE
jgi:hypothetical protein